MILKWRNHEDIRKWMYSGHIISRKEHAIFMEVLKEDNKNFYWLARNKSGEYLGVISINKIDFRNRNVYLGIYANPKLSKIGGVLMQCLKTLCFDMIHLHTLKAEVTETNKRAIAFYKKYGFTEEGRLREFVFKEGKWLDVVIMGIINVS